MNVVDVSNQTKMRDMSIDWFAWNGLVVVSGMMGLYIEKITTVMIQRYMCCSSQTLL